MTRDEILKQIQQLPEHYFLQGYGGFAHDLQKCMKDDERIEGICEVSKKNIFHFVKNTRAIRNYIAVTNKNIYLITHGRVIMSCLPFLNRTEVIQRNTITGIEEKPVSALLKIFYSYELTLKTTSKNYTMYVTSDYKKRLENSGLLDENRMAGGNNTQNNDI